MKKTDKDTLRKYLKDFLTTDFIKSAIQNEVFMGKYRTRIELATYLRDNWVDLTSLPEKKIRLDNSPFKADELIASETIGDRFIGDEQFKRFFRKAGFRINGMHQHLLFLLFAAFTDIPETKWKELTFLYQEFNKEHYRPKQPIESYFDEIVFHFSTTYTISEEANKVTYRSSKKLNYLKGIQFVVYFKKTTDNKIYRNFLRFTDEIDGSKDKERITVEYCSEKKINDLERNDLTDPKMRIDMEGKAFLGAEDDHLSFKLYFKPENRILFLRANLRGIDWRQNNEEVIISGTRSINNREALYSGSVIFRKILPFHEQQGIFSAQNRIAGELNKSHYLDDLEEYIVYYLSGSGSISSGAFRSKQQFMNDALSKAQITGVVKNNKLVEMLSKSNRWVSISRILDQPNQLSLNYWDFESIASTNVILATRTSLNSVYSGTVSECSQEYAWFNLTDTVERKFIVGKRSNSHGGRVIKALTTSIYKNRTLKDEPNEMLVARELIIPQELLPKKILEDVKKHKRSLKQPINYNDFVNSDLSRELKGYLADRKSSTLSFPSGNSQVTTNKQHVFSEYGRRISYRSLSGRFFIYVGDVNGEKSLFRYCLEIDDLGTTTLSKKQNSKRIQNYVGYAQQFEKTLTLQLEHKAEAEEPIEQNIHISLLCQQGDASGTILTGLMTDTVESIPYSCACLIIPVEKLPQSPFRPAKVIYNRVEYLSLEELLPKGNIEAFFEARGNLIKI